MISKYYINNFKYILKLKKNNILKKLIIKYVYKGKYLKPRIIKNYIKLSPIIMPFILFCKQLHNKNFKLGI